MPAVAAFLLAQARSGVAQRSNEILRWTAVLTVSIVALILVGYLVYRLMMRSLADSDTGPAFDLAELRNLRDSGQLTAEEYERAKARLIAAVQAQVDGPTELPTGKAPPADGAEPSPRPPNLPPPAGPETGDTDP